MTHPRLIAGNGRVAHSSLIGKVDADWFSDGTERQVSVPVADLLREPGGGLDRQLLLGAGFLVLEDVAGFSFGQSIRDGYVGYIATAELSETEPVSHRITALSSHIYSAPDMKSRATGCLPFGAEVRIISEENGFSALADATFITQQHLQPLNWVAPDYVSVFESFIGIPYLWGGNSTWGMDCSGAVQLALEAAGFSCPRDSDMQEADLGQALDENTNLARGDLIFWKRHVGVMQDSETLIHANAYHMAVASEPLVDVAARVFANGDGPVTSRRRL